MRILEGDERDRALRQWMRGCISLTVRVTVMSFGFTLLVGALIVLVNQVMQRDAAASTDILGVRIDLSPIAEAGYDLPLLVVALGAWVGMTSLSRLVMHRQVRDYLHGTAPGDGGDDDLLADDAADDPDGAEGGNALVERMLLEVYMAMVNSTARALGITVVLGVMLPKVLLLGMALVWLAAIGVALYRFRLGQRACDELQASARARRKAPDAQTHRELVDSIYWRDRFLTRLPIGQAAVLVGSMLVFVVVPFWILEPGEGSAASLIVLLLWLQTMLTAVIESGSLGFRHVFWYRRRDGVRPEAVETPGKPVVSLLTTDGRFWPDTDVVWARAAGSDRVLVAFAGPEVGVGGMRPAALARLLRAQSVSLVTLRDRPFLAGANGYAGLGDDLAGALESLADLIDLSGAVVVGSGPGIEPARALADRQSVVRVVELNDPDDDFVRRLVRAGRLAEIVDAWFDADVTDAEARRREAEAVGAHAG